MGKTLTAAIVSVCWVALVSAQAKKQEDHPKIVMGLANEGWTLEFDAPGYKIDVSGLQPDGRDYFLATNPSTNVTISVYLERVSGKQPRMGAKTTESNGCHRT